MAKAEKPERQPIPTAGNAQTPIFLVNPNEEAIICDVCGHANPKSTGLCKMCSNYLRRS